MIYDNSRKVDNNEIVNLVFKGLYKVRVLYKDDNIWFCGPDISNILDYSLASNMYRMLSREDKLYVELDKIVNTPKYKGKPKMVFISLIGISKILSKSRLDIAREFRNWIYGEIASSIYNKWLNNIT